jgi:signal transduction histidine kinase
MTESENDRIAILVHEVRSPVAALSAVAEALSDVEEGSARRELVRLALGACAAIERIVTDIAVASVQPAPLDLARLVRDLVAERAVASVVVRADVDDDLPEIHGDPVRLRQVLDNLVGNALQHGGDAVIVRALRATGGVTISVVDHGGGIAAEDLERIFEPGVRLDPARPGSGLGLALVRSIVEAHGGTLDVASRLGDGSTFTIHLPAAQPAT